MLVPRGGLVEHLTDLRDARAAVGPRLARLADLLERAGPTTDLVGDRPARNTLAKAHDHGGLPVGRVPRRGIENHVQRDCSDLSEASPGRKTVKVTFIAAWTRARRRGTRQLRGCRHRVFYGSAGRPGGCR